MSALNSFELAAITFTVGAFLRLTGFTMLNVKSGQVDRLVLDKFREQGYSEAFAQRALSGVK